MRYDICVFGGCSVDLMYYLDEEGNANEKPDIISYGGKGSNQAVAASRAGAKVTMISRIGKDKIGQDILDNLVYNGVSINIVEIIEGLENDQSKIYINKDDKDNEIKRLAGAIKSFTPDMVANYKSVLLSSKVVVTQTKMPKEVIVELINFCYENAIPIIVTPCPADKLFIGDDGNRKLIEKITYITANREECQTIFGIDDIEYCVGQYPNKLIVTLGESGVMYNDGSKNIYIDALKNVEVIDTTGAGDTFCGNLAYCLTNGYTLKDAIIRSQFASALKIGKETAQEGMPYKDELDNFIGRYS